MDVYDEDDNKTRNTKTYKTNRYIYILPYTTITMYVNGNKNVKILPGK